MEAGRGELGKAFEVGESLFVVRLILPKDGCTLGAIGGRTPLEEGVPLSYVLESGPRSLAQPSTPQSTQVGDRGRHAPH
eukprot:5774298-Pyramimonas_sp.AAC.1